MSLPNELLPLGLLGKGTTTTGYQITRSLRFNSADSAYLSRTPVSTGNRKTFTWSGWVKRARVSSGNIDPFFSAGSGFFAGGDQNIVMFQTDDTFYAIDYTTSSGSYLYEYRSSRVFRDPTAWYHIVFVVDTTQATTTNRVRLYVNGVQDTVNTVTYPTLNADTKVNNTVAHYLGAAPSYYAGLYLADVHFIDGQALTPSSFGETDANGIWQPKAYTGTYGTNGFQLKFADNSAATATTLGKDTSGNGNNWTPNNFSVTAGVGNDSLVDSPTNYGSDTGVGGEVRGNYCVFSPLEDSNQTKGVLSNGNLDITAGITGSTFSGSVGSIAVNSGKYYWEYTINALSTDSGPGIINADSLNLAAPGSYGFSAASDCWWRGAVSLYNNSSVSATGLTSLANGSVAQVALDLNAGKVWFGVNGVWDSSGNPGAGTNPSATFSVGSKYFYPMVQGYGSPAWAGSINFGQRPFAYTAPSGFKALCTQNLPAPTITNPSTVMDVKTIVGADQAYTGFNFSPDLIWLKRRDSTENHYIFDQVRGGNGLLYTNSTSAEITGTTYISEFGSNSFTTTNSLLGAGAQYVAWTWDAGSSTVTNTSGTISSQVRANASAGFSIVTYTGTGTASETVGHGLGVMPKLYIIKSRNVVDNWGVYTSNILSSPSQQYLFLNTTAAAATAGQAMPTSTVLNITSSFDNQARNYVAYCFAPVAGYSSFGSYTGNGSADGPFVYTGFRPRWVMVKAVTDASYNWFVIDSARNTYNALDASLYPNSTSADAIFAWADFTANGFKIRSNSGALNTNISTYIYAAFAEAPFALARAR